MIRHPHASALSYSSKVLFVVLCTFTLAIHASFGNAPTSHHSVTITATITGQGKGSNPYAENISHLDNAMILETAIENSPPSNYKPSDLDIVQDDDSGQVDIIVRANASIFYTFGDESDATEVSSIEFITSATYLNVRILDNFVLNIPSQSSSAAVCIQMTDHLSKTNASLISGSSTFFGGTNPNAEEQFLIRGQITTGKRVYVFIDSND